jgi:8-oxo-dGTP pyrophosphatase MutT (NUDIX family)
MIKKKIVNGVPRHFIVGIIIEKKGKYLLMERSDFPYGFAAPAGHINEGETIKEALQRKLKGETGLEIIKKKEILREIISLTPCRIDGTYDHMAYIYKVKARGVVKIDKNEFESYGWYSKKEIFDIKLEPMWSFVFNKMTKGKDD